jgi:hypothetical protein
MAKLTVSLISFKITLKGMEELNFKIEKKDKFRIVGIASQLPKEIEENTEIVPLIWHNARLKNFSSYSPDNDIKNCNRESKVQFDKYRHLQVHILFIMFPALKEQHKIS